MTRLPNLPSALASKAPAIAPNAPKPLANVTKVSLRELQPTMIVRENVFAKDGTLLISVGRVLTEASIHRINDLSGLLKSTTFTVEVVPKPDATI